MGHTIKCYMLLLKKKILEVDNLHQKKIYHKIQKIYFNNYKVNYNSTFFLSVSSIKENLFYDIIIHICIKKTSLRNILK